MKRKPTPSRKTGAVRSKKAKVDGIDFASSLEAYCYSKLKENGLEFQYEGESFVVLDGFRFLGTYKKATAGKKEMVDNGGKVVRSITYTPDFVLPNGVIIETKGRFVAADRRKHLEIKKIQKNGLRKRLSI